jgi:hypothetical protein
MKKVIEWLERIKIDLDTHCITWHALELLDKALAELKAPPSWETPEQWEKRTGEALQDNAMVLWKRKGDKYQDWSWADLSTYAHFKIHCGGHPERCICLVFSGPYMPPDGWKPEEA